MRTDRGRGHSRANVRLSRIQLAQIVRLQMARSGSIGLSPGRCGCGEMGGNEKKTGMGSGLAVSRALRGRDLLEVWRGRAAARGGRAGAGVAMRRNLNSE